MPERTPVIAACVRTPQGKGGGVFSDVSSMDLARPLVEEILSSVEIAPKRVNDVRWGCSRQIGEQGHNFARVLALTTELGETVPGCTVDRLCSSSAQALIGASDAIYSGHQDAVLVGGVENMSRVGRHHEMGDAYPRFADIYDLDRLQVGITAETVAERYGITRREQDEYSLRSHRRAARATDSGRFEEEIVPIDTPDGVITEDEGIRRTTDIDALSNLPPAFKEGGSVTAGNASQISDGAAAVLITSREFAEDNDLEFMATVGHRSIVGVDPALMGIGPIPATKRLLQDANRTIADYDLIELNEAFASQAIHCQRELDIPDDRFNVNGGAIALGHPIGATGARLPVTLVHEMINRDVDLGIATECVGYGQGVAIEFARR